MTTLGEDDFLRQYQQLSVTTRKKMNILTLAAVAKPRLKIRTQSNSP